MKLRDYMQSPTLTMEDAQSSREKELVIFGKLAPGGLETLEQLATQVEYMEQYTWLVDYTSTGGIKGQMRVRQYGRDTQVRYEMTTKAYDGPGDALESNVEINVEMFTAFKAMAPGGQLKTRYTLPVEGTDLVWEVDVIYNKIGSVVPWTKIDLEVPASLQAIPPLPEGIFDRVIDKPRSERSAEEEAILNDLFDNQFFVPNPHAPEMVPDLQVRERIAVIRDRLLAHCAVMRDKGVEDPTLESLANSLAPDGIGSNGLGRVLEDRISRRALVAIIRPYIDALTAYIPALSYNASYVGEPEGELKSSLKELEYMLLRLSPPKVVVEDDCDCNE